MIKKIICICLTCFLCLSIFSSCGRGSKFKNSNTIVVMAYNKGYGTEWLEDIAKDYNKILKENNEPFEIVIEDTDFMANSMVQNVRSKLGEDVFFSVDTGFQEGIVDDLFEDLSDMLVMKGEDTDEKTIGDKIVNIEEWEKIASKYGSGIYMLPNNISIIGMVFDYDLFLDNGWLDYASVEDFQDVLNDGLPAKIDGDKIVYTQDYDLYKQGDRVLSKGKDNIYGTYDDGQKTTIEEFENLWVNKIEAENYKEFIYASQGTTYLNNILYEHLLQNAGEDEYNAIVNYGGLDGENVTINGQETKVKIDDNGYLVFSSDYIQKAMDFTYNWFLDSNRVHESSYSFQGTGKSYAQQYFLTGYSFQNYRSAFLVDGNWWENETRAFMQGLEKGRKYGEREYRFYLLPTISGQKMPSDQTGLSALETGAIAVAKQSDPNKLKTIKEFIAYVLSDKNLSKSTVKTGAIKNYKYKILDDDIDKMTPFQKQCFAIKNDNEHIKLRSNFIDRYSVPLTYSSVKYVKKMSCEFMIYDNGNSFTDSFAKAVYMSGGQSYNKDGLEHVKKQIKNIFSKENWADIWLEAKPAYDRFNK